MGSPGNTRMTKKIMVTKIKTMGMVSNRRVIKNLRNDEDIINSHYYQMNNWGQGFPRPQVSILQIVRLSKDQAISMFFSVTCFFGGTT